jgi:hypothetical protein
LTNNKKYAIIKAQRKKGDKKMTTISVKNLKEILSQFNDNALVGLTGGEDAGGSWAQLNIVHQAHFVGNGFEYDDFVEDYVLMEDSD